MKIARFASPDEDPRFGVVDGDDLVVLAGDPMYAGYETTGERVPMSGVKILAPVIPRSKVVGIGLNYYDHADEMGQEAPEFPVVFLKPNTTVIGPGDAIQLPPVEGQVDLEGELAIVIGSIAKKVRPEDYADVVFGYTIANDVTARTVQQSDGQWTRAKSYDTFCPIGPYIETELDWTDVTIQSRVDGELLQRETTQHMIHKIPDLVAYVSQIFTLLPGDIILTGTPAGVGPFTAGQTVEISIDGLGSLINPVRNRD
ncbi:fumarylacetoacetate hydrolase family protein [Frondihabitans australicus]|uniref:2-keto-4-pentenoate hydratase/2-oxohepta-3-ene-1,7-dioic acid hydratase in catechol pathway n=1 Tax=Frondihabitans australicus TaxID=386892 RepID=A0A495IJ70_9MICO|nr:fumarylacetoacetate hydrolase family protein [Frondihabitans australicus]RKR75341.1 2-keto-4-pentenoate hydratase/2-oxohepta-3-ene-1,7-dioic acid hydratase in catechol pathway [Frondihabitans australicus]